ncbi:hypothetical protein DAPPUDRAFT_320073 [Daphnia pulex]|uniref:Uncharacterized protein n=1 Tax=Daphnia pulex TaxID=6669 RepID=E9GNR9_DAPPU|nr:hypothetical protein DAPPUDRAFT_320073 [Daphnia pulex]|eukprot:EFX78807.1 hypothetical protein DAPPUDRAFT_320073 [Daphnia pulex]
MKAGIRTCSCVKQPHTDSDSSSYRICLIGNMERKGCDLRSEEQKARVKKYINDSRRKGMKSFGLFASGANNSGDGCKQKSSELVAQSRNKRKRDESFYLWPDIHDQPADSFHFEPDFNQTVPNSCKVLLKVFLS